MLPKRHRLKSREDFHRVFRSGRPIYLDGVLCLWAPSSQLVTRVGIAFKGKALPRAATRNRYKRKMTEALRPMINNLPPSLDLVLLFQKRRPQETYGDFEKIVRRLVESLTHRL